MKMSASFQCTNSELSLLPFLTVSSVPLGATTELVQWRLLAILQELGFVGTR
jgi:hypothetical protein